MPEGSFTSSTYSTTAGPFTGTGVGGGTLSMNGQALAVTQATVATDVHETLDVHRNFAAQVAFHLVALFEFLTDFVQFFSGEIIDAASPVGRPKRQEFSRPLHGRCRRCKSTRCPRALPLGRSTPAILATVFLLKASPGAALCRGFSQITLSTPLRRMTLHFGQIFLRMA